MSVHIAEPVGAPLLCRPRRDDDLPAIVSWVADARELHLFTGPVLSWPLTVEALRGLAHDIPGYHPYALTLEPEGPIVGHFDVTVAGTTARVGRVLLDPAHRGRRLATPLMRHAIEVARGFGATELRLNVIDGNAPAIRTYVALGFREIPRTPQQTPDALPMLLELRPLP